MTVTSTTRPRRPIQLPPLTDTSRPSVSTGSTVRDAVNAYGRGETDISTLDDRELTESRCDRVRHSGRLVMTKALLTVGAVRSAVTPVGRQ